MAAKTPPETFRRRAEFLRLAARGRKLSRPGFLMQALVQPGDAPVRVGYTATKKIGNAVLRNRARRRLREAARLVLAAQPLCGVELVLVCRKETATLPFSTLCASLDSALAELRK
jgi:ribonuclease P protein component